MKKMLVHILALIMMLSLVACGNENELENASGQESNVTTDDNTNAMNSINDEEISEEPQKLNIEMCKNEHVSVMLDHLEDGKIYVCATNLTDEDIRLDINYIDVDGVMYTNTFEGEMIYSGKTQVYELVIYDRDTGEKVKYSCKMGSEIDGQFEYFSKEYTYCEDINFGPLTVKQ